MLKNPNAVYSLAYSHIISKALSIATKYELDKHVPKEGVVVKKLAELLSFNIAAFERFLRLLDAYGVVLLDGDKVYATELTAQLVDIRSPHMLKSYEAFEEFEHTLKANESGWDKVFGQAFYPSLSGAELSQFAKWCQHSGDVWLEGLLSFYDFSGYQKIVDVGGGNGHFLAEILKRNPEQCGVLFDRPEVVSQAEEVFVKAGCLERIELVGGDFFESVPENGELYTICRALLNWSDDKAIEILNTCARSMPKSARLLIIDFVLPDKTHPHYLRSVCNDVNLMTIIDSSQRSEAQWKSIIAKSDLEFNQLVMSKADMQPEPFAPIGIFECQRLG